MNINGNQNTITKTHFNMLFQSKINMSEFTLDRFTEAWSSFEDLTRIFQNLKLIKIGIVCTLQ